MLKLLKTIATEVVKQVTRVLRIYQILLDPNFYIRHIFMS